MNQERKKGKKNLTGMKETAMKILFLVCACISILSVTVICVFLFAGGFPAIAEIGFFEFIFGTTWRPTAGQYGILTMIVGSIYVTAGAIIIGVPLGLLAAVFLAYYCPPALYRILKPAVELLAGIPSIVYGFFALVVIVPAIRGLFGGSGMGILTASIVNSYIMPLDGFSYIFLLILDLEIAYKFVLMIYQNVQALFVLISNQHHFVISALQMNVLKHVE